MSKEIFGKIYAEKAWGDGSDLLPLSGSGSNFVNARPYVGFVEKIVNKFDIKTLVDLGHGDWSMWKEYQFNDVKYLGIDVAEGLSEKMQKILGGENRKFIYLDFQESEIPSSQMLICKDVLQHLSNFQIMNLLDNLNNFDYIIFCNDIYIRKSIFFEIREMLQIRKRFNSILHLKNPLFLNLRINNRNIVVGSFRGIDLEKKPFKNFLSSYTLMDWFDYDGPQRIGIKKRVYLYKRKSTS